MRFEIQRAIDADCDGSYFGQMARLLHEQEKGMLDELRRSASFWFPFDPAEAFSPAKAIGETDEEFKARVMSRLPPEGENGG